MKLELSKLLAEQETELAFSGEAPCMFADDFPDVRFPETIHVEGSVTNSAGYMQLTLKAALSYTALCARCLTPIDGMFPIAMTKRVATERVIADMTEDAAEAYLPIVGTELDIGAAIVEEMLLSFPARHLCKPDCLGLCPKCGKDLNEGECGCPKREVDPRLAVLLTLLDD